MERPGLALAYAGQLASDRIKKVLAAHGLRPGAGHALLLLSDAGVMSQQSLMEALGADPSVLVSILNDLELAGLLQRRRDPQDRRRHNVEILERGRETVAAIHDALDAVEAELFGDLDDGERDTLLRVLGRVEARGAASCSQEC